MIRSKHKKILTALVLFIVTTIDSAAVAATTFTDAVSFNLSGLNNAAFTFGANSNILQLTVNVSSFSIMVQDGSSFVLSGPSGYTLANSASIPVGCGSGERRTVSYDATGTATITFSPAATSEPCVSQTSSGSSGSSTSASTGSSGASSASASAPSTPSSTANPQTATPAAQPAQSDKPASPTFTNNENRLKGTKVFGDTGWMSKAQSQMLSSILGDMELKGYFRWPASDNFGPRSITTAGFAAQLLAYLSNTGCKDGDGYGGVQMCLRRAQQNELIPDKFNFKTRVKRIEFYEGILKAKNLALLPLPEGDPKLICSDLGGVTNHDLQVYYTLRQHKIASLYSGRKCQLLLYMRRYEAVTFIDRALGK